MKLVFGLLMAVPIILLLLALYIGDFLYSIAILLGVGIAFIALIGALGRQHTQTKCPHCGGKVRTGDATCLHCRKPI